MSDSLNFSQAVSHEAFMQKALYDPDNGYYAHHAAVGKSGDFSTSATLSPAFAEAIANWCKNSLKTLGLSAPCPLIELGPGDGSLALALSQILGAEWPLRLVETSEPLQAVQKERLKHIAYQSHENLKDALKASNGTALIIANEFADAFPAVQLRWQDGQWWEAGVQFDSEGQAEICVFPFERAIDADAPANPREGQQIFVHPSYHAWLKENLPALKCGAMLTIDYGANVPAKECRAYANQERFEGLDVYQKPGKRDITCDINFTDVQRWTCSLGLQVDDSISQCDFLQTQLENFEARCETDKALAFLSHPLGAGGAFRTLSAYRQ